ncbi:MAG: hypothetical protein GY808_01290, partial [Gammaproteobacteria bacterium]|nr:hypothetical protein [Gammaproteobacteria bacterium]
ITLIVTDNDGYSDEDQIDIMIKAQIDDCDSKDGWGSANTLEINTVNQKQGTGCLESTGSNSAEFTKVFSVPISADSSTSIGFWYYVSDINMLRSTNQVEFGSGGKADVNEYNWPLENLKTGWNYIILYFENATVSGGDPNLDAINWFRLYNFKNGSVTTMIDDFRFRGSSGNQAPIADAGENQNIKSESGSSASVTLDGSASFDVDGSIESYSWSKGDVEFATGVKASVTLSEGTHIITLTVTDNAGATNSGQVTIAIDGGYLDDCDTKTDWDSSNKISVNTTDQKQGLGCLETTGLSPDDFKKVFSKPVS